MLSARSVLDAGNERLGHLQRIALRLVLDLVCVALAAEQAGGARGCPEMERPAGHLTPPPPA